MPSPLRRLPLKAERPWRIGGAHGVLEVTGRTQNGAGKRMTAAHRAIRIREKWIGPFPPFPYGRAQSPRYSAVSSSIADCAAGGGSSRHQVSRTAMGSASLSGR